MDFGAHGHHREDVMNTYEDLQNRESFAGLVSIGDDEEDEAWDDFVHNSAHLVNEGN